MSKPTDNPADPFKKALAEATKVMAHDPDLTVSYSVDPSGLSGDAMRLPQVSRRMTRDEVMLARGTADALALHRRYHNDALHARYAPPGAMARDLYEAMETARCEAMGARDMPGHRWQYRRQDRGMRRRGRGMSRSPKPRTRHWRRRRAI